MNMPWEMEKELESIHFQDLQLMVTVFLSLNNLGYNVNGEKRILVMIILGCRTKGFAFRPPKNSWFLIGLIKRLLPLILRLRLKVVAVDVREGDIRNLIKLKAQRVILTPSHSGGFESCILFHLSTLLGEEFNYIACKELFEPSPVAWLLQRLGGYSIVRGTPDRDSFRMTRQLLVEGKRWLVIFPEGEVCWHNDTVMPFHQGVAQLAFWAYEDIAKQGVLPSLHLVPTAIKYVYLYDMRREIASSLLRLERKLFLPPQTLTLYDRLRRVGEMVLTANERGYNVRPREGASLEERIQHIKELIISHAAMVLSVSLRPEQPLLDRIRTLLNAVDHIIYSEPEGTDYERQLHHHRQQEAQTLYDELYRVLRFIALHDGYVRERLTAERFLDVLGLLELEVFGHRRICGPRKAILKIGSPLNLMDYLSHYRTDKQSALQEVTISLESSVRQMLTGLSRLTVPIERV